MSRCVASVLTSLSLSVSLYCLQSLLFTPLSFSLDHFSLFLAPSPLSSLSISLSYSFKSTVSIVSLIFNLSVPPILHFCTSFALNESGGSQRCLTVLHHRNWQHHSPIIACQRRFADAPSLFFTSQPSSSSLSLSRALAPPQQRSLVEEVEAATDGAEPHKQPLYYNYSKSVKTAQKGALWDTRALQRKYL